MQKFLFFLFPLVDLSFVTINFVFIKPNIFLCNIFLNDYILCCCFFWFYGCCFCCFYCCCCCFLLFLLLSSFLVGFDVVNFLYKCAVRIMFFIKLQKKEKNIPYRFCRTVNCFRCPDQRHLGCTQRTQWDYYSELSTGRGEAGSKRQVVRRCCLGPPGELDNELLRKVEMEFKYLARYKC